MQEVRKRLIKDLVVTGVASPILILLLAFLGGGWIVISLAMPLNELAIKIGSWIDTIFPPRGGWFEGAGTYALSILILASFEVWVALFVFARLIRFQMSRREKRDAEDFASLQLK
ncbi:MAG: hypothetical protein WBE72_21480 [Terracidiphilus sp.]